MPYGLPAVATDYVLPLWPEMVTATSWTNVECYILCTEQ